jgi:LytR cell envelope-related transcriptional attenuator
MTSEPPYSDHGGSGGGDSNEERRGSGIAPVRAFVVLVLFVVASIALVAVGTRHSVSGDAATPPTTTPTTAATGGHKTAPTTTTTTVPHSSVTVVVANATETNGLGAHYSSILTAQGWAVQAPVDAATTEAASSVYYAAGQQGAATSIATTLGLKPAVVLPLTTSIPVAGVSGDDVVVVVGSDLVPAAT